MPMQKFTLQEKVVYFGDKVFWWLFIVVNENLNLYWILWSYFQVLAYLLLSYMYHYACCALCSDEFQLEFQFWEDRKWWNCSTASFSMCHCLCTHVHANRQKYHSWRILFGVYEASKLWIWAFFATYFKVNAMPASSHDYWPGGGGEAAFKYTVHLHPVSEATLPDQCICMLFNKDVFMLDFLVKDFMIIIIICGSKI